MARRFKVFPVVFLISILLAGCSGGDGLSGTAPASPPDTGSPAPTVSLSAGVASVAPGGSTTLIWSSTHATACTASGGWSGAKATSGSEARTNITATTAYVLTCSGAGGSTNQSVSVAVQSTNPPATVPNPAHLIFFDGFEYAVSRSDVNAASLFQTQGGWNGAKTEQSGQTGANGWLYTVASVPGYSGALPGSASSRVLAIEARPGTEGMQTDFYLEYGDEQADPNTIPGDVWFQFWIYINDYGSEHSLVDSRNKFLYPCSGAYPCQTGKWMVSLVDHSTEPYWVYLSGTPGTPSATGGYLTATPQALYGATEVVNTGATAYDNRYKLGHHNTAEYVTTNRWTLVKIHFDTSTAAGSYEAWMRPLGGAWTKVADWRSGVTPGFTWTINPGFIGGHRVLRMPSTMGRASGSGYDTWYYMDDFAMAISEAGLPVYP